MSMLIVNGISLPDPDGGLVISRSQGAEASRNALYQMVASPINRRIIKFDTLAWSNISPEEWSKVAIQIDKFTGVLKFWEPVSRTFKYMDIYWGDEKMEVLRANNDGAITHYKKCSCNIIDMGYPFKSGW